jgi:hypothetical protein
MILIKFVVLCFIVFLYASPSCELVVFDPSKWLYRTRSEGLTGYSCLSVLLPLRVRLGHLSWNNSGGSTTFGGAGGKSLKHLVELELRGLLVHAWETSVVQHLINPHACIS